MSNVVWKIAAGALIPSAAAIIFNLLNFAFENRDKNPFPLPGVSNFDIAAGLAFSLLGMCVAMSDPAKINKLFMLFASLIIIIIAGDMLLPLFFPAVSKIYFVSVVNICALFALCWVINVA